MIGEGLYYGSMAFLLVISSFSYILSNLSGVDERIVNMGFIALIFYFNILVAGVNGLHIPGRFVPVYILFFILFWMTAVSIAKNSLSEWAPSFLRFFGYLLVLYNSWYLAKRGRSSFRVVDLAVMLMLIVAVLGGLWEIATGSVQFKNGAYRVAGHFNHHQLGYALLLFVLCGYMLNVTLKRPLDPLFRLFARFLFLSGLVFMLLARSRMLTIAFFASLYAAHLLAGRSFLKKLRVIIAGGAVLSGLVYTILNTDLFPRLKELFSMEELDPSTNYRLTIIQDSFQGLSSSEFWTGIGMGGFNEFFYEISGVLGVAAHNDYLLMFVEGGVFALFFYVVYQIWTVFFLRKRVMYVRYDVDDRLVFGIGLATLMNFTGVEIMGFLLNAHYFFHSEFLIMLIAGIFLGKQAGLKGGYDRQAG